MYFSIKKVCMAAAVIIMAVTAAAAADNTIIFEAETIDKTYFGQSGENTTGAIDIYDGNEIYRFCSASKQPSVSGEVRFEVNVPADGYYKINVDCTTSDLNEILGTTGVDYNRGEYQIVANEQICGTTAFFMPNYGKIGTLYDEFPAYAYLHQGENTISLKIFNDSSVRYLSIDKIRLERTDGRELHFPLAALSPDISCESGTASTGTSGVYIQANSAANNVEKQPYRYWFFSPNPNGISEHEYKVSFDIDVKNGAEYDLSVVNYSRYTQGGIWEVSVNGMRVSEKDFFRTVTQDKVFSKIDIGKAVFNSGTNTISFTLKGKNAESNDYKLQLKEIILTNSGKISEESNTPYLPGHKEPPAYSAQPENISVIDGTTTLMFTDIKPITGSQRSPTDTEEVSRENMPEWLGSTDIAPEFGKFLVYQPSNDYFKFYADVKEKGYYALYMTMYSEYAAKQQYVFIDGNRIGTQGTNSVRSTKTEDEYCFGSYYMTEGLHEIRVVAAIDTSNAPAAHYYRQIRFEKNTAVNAVQDLADNYLVSNGKYTIANTTYNFHYLQNLTVGDMLELPFELECFGVYDISYIAAKTSSPTPKMNIYLDGNLVLKDMDFSAILGNTVFDVIKGIYLDEGVHNLKFVCSETPEGSKIMIGNIISKLNGEISVCEPILTHNGTEISALPSDGTLEFSCKTGNYTENDTTALLIAAYYKIVDNYSVLAGISSVARTLGDGYMANLTANITLNGVQTGDYMEIFSASAGAGCIIPGNKILTVYR